MSIIREEIIGDCRLLQGDCLDILPTLDSVDAIVTSPPYAEQRKEQYGGIPEHRYPFWTAQWFMAIENGMVECGNYLVNIREHLSGGEISDYVHKTRMLLRDVGFVECDELIWIKPDAPPVGAVNRPRRSWERVLWFSNSTKPYCDAKANGTVSDRIGLDKTQAGDSSSSWINGYSDGMETGIARHKDYCEYGTGRNDSAVDHPARFPTPFAEWMVKGWSPECGTIIDPFMGSGTTGIACVKHGRRFIGIERSPKYFDIAVDRIKRAYADQALFAEVAK